MDDLIFKLNSFYNNTVIKYDTVDVFKNPNKLPINQVFLEWNYLEMKRNIDVTNNVDDDDDKEWEGDKDVARSTNTTSCKSQSEIIAALDKRWLPKCLLYTYKSYNLIGDERNNDANDQFINLNLNYLETLYYLEKLSYHQFWCMVIYHSHLPGCLSSFLQNAIPPHQEKQLQGKYLDIYRRVYFGFLHVYERLLEFHVSDTEYMSPEFGMKQLVNRKLINLPYVASLLHLYSRRTDFCNKLVQVYFNNVTQVEIHVAEIKEIIHHTNLVVQTVDKNVNRKSDDSSSAIAIALQSLPARPAVFQLEWLYDTVSYLLNAMATLNALFQHYKPAVEIALQMNFPYRLPTFYVEIYREIFTMVSWREEMIQMHTLAGNTIDEINLGRTEFIDCFHAFVSYCLDKTLENMGNEELQQIHVETCLKLFNTALDEEYFICDYNAKYNVENLLDMFESCYDIDKARTEFVVNCIARLPRHMKLECVGAAAACAPSTIEDIFRNFKPINNALGDQNSNGKVDGIKVDDSLSKGKKKEDEEGDVEEKIEYILDILPHLGDAFVFKCLQHYKYNVDVVIRAILDDNLPPQLASIPPNIIRIFAKPQQRKTKKPVFKGGKPTHKDVMALLDDKSDLQKVKEFILNGAQYEPTEEEDAKIQHVQSEFPQRPPYEFVFDCLKHYKFNTADTINAIRSETLPSHLAPTTFDLDVDGKKMQMFPNGRLNRRLRRRQPRPTTSQVDGVQCGNENVYDDEYDDRLNDNVKINSFGIGGLYTTPDPSYWVFKDVTSSSEEGEDEEEEEKEDFNRMKNRLNFCTDPAVLRAKREAKFGGGGGTSSKSLAKQNSASSDKQTELNRAKKEVHKSSRANHNRKKGAQWKRNRGMLPG